MGRMGGESGRTWQSWAVPLVAGFVVSTMVVALLVPPQLHSLTWRTLPVHSAGLLAVAVAVVVAGVWGMHRLFREHFGSRPSTAVLACAWSSAIWLPLLFLLQSEHALWVVAAPLPMAVIVTHFAKRQVLEEADAPQAMPRAGNEALFDSVAALRSGRMAGIALVAAALLQAVMATFGAGLVTWTESLLILLTSVLVWGLSSQTAVTADGMRREQVWRRGSVLPCFLLTCLALTPFLRQALMSAALKNVVLAGVASRVKVPHIVSASSYSGAILTTLPQPKRRIEAPAPVSVISALALRKPLLIPFDGVYWFYQYPDHAPGKDAPSERGDPTVKFVSSNDGIPLRMEAHQRLSTLLRSDCCSALRVEVKNADNRIGAIAVEVVLRDRSTPGAPLHSLGTVPIKSSQLEKISLTRAAAEESLRFRMRHGVPFRFNEVAVVFHLDRGREMASARVKINGFMLEP
jgi:hypothetical protein